MSNGQRSKWLALVACGALVALAAGCSDSKAGCKEGQTDCDGKCVDLASDEDHCGKCGTTCDEGKGFICSSSSCTCLGGGTDCDGTCVNTTADAKNCGECGKACADGEVCNGGNCEAGGACEAPKKVCGDSCIDIQSDNQNCGDCGVKCDETKGYTCVVGDCVCAKDLIECGDTCVNPNTAVDNCGSCGNACGDNEVCQGGACVGGCTEPLTDCDGSCVDTSSDNNNCGACGTTCTTANGLICKSGTCACAIGTDCSGQCVDMQTNGNHCGACGNVCDPGQACKNGVCSIDCDPLTQCGNQCVDTQTNVDNCGACGTACTGGMVCSAGDCACPAAAPEDCSGQCADLQTDEQHCGSCGNACTGGQSCVAGQCQAAQLLSVVIECPQTTVPIGTVQNCTATGTLQDGNTVPLTGDPNLTWDLDNDTCVANASEGAQETLSSKISNTPPTKGQLTVKDEGYQPGCSVDVKATYVAGTQTLISPSVTITITDRKLLTIAIAPDNPTVPYLETSDTEHLVINFKVLGTFDSGQVREVQRVGNGGPQPSWAWVSGNKTTADFATPGAAIGRAELTDKNTPSGSATSQITVTYFEDTSDSTTERTANTLLTVVPGNATGASIQPSTATIPLGTIMFNLIVNFNNVLDFDVTDICAARGTWPDGSPSPIPFTKHYENYCGYMMHEVAPTSTGPTTSATWSYFKSGASNNELIFPADAPPYTSRQQELTADKPTAATAAVVEGNFDDGAYTANRVFARANVTIGDAALIACRLRINKTLTWVDDEADDEDFLGRAADPTNNRFPVNLQGYQVEVVGLYSDNDTNGVRLTDKVTYSTTNSAIADPSNGAGTEGETDFGQVGVATVTATEPGSGVTCSATVEVVQGKLCGVRLVPLFKNKVGRRAYQVDTNDEPTPGRIDGPGQTTHPWINRVFLPNEANWSQGYRLDAWYATDYQKGCPGGATYDNDVTGCSVSWNSDLGEFEDPNGLCFRIDVTGQGTYEVVPDPALTVADPAISLNGAVATTKVSTDNPFRQDEIKATFIDGLTAVTKETVTVCGKRVADPDLHVEVWDTFTDMTQTAVKQTIPVAGKTQYRASLWFEMGKDASDNQLYCGKVDNAWNSNEYDIYGYRMEITEDVSNWGTGASGTATVANDVTNRGEITGVAVGTTTITATFAGHSNVLNVEVGELDVQSCEVLVPATTLYHGAGVGETLRPTVSATLSDGNTVDITNGFKASFCKIDVDGDKWCEIDWSMVVDADGTGSDYFNIDNDDSAITAGEGLVRAHDANDSTNSRHVQAICDGCKITGTGTTSVTCTVSPVIEAKPATISKLFIQTGDKTCYDAEPASLKMTQDTVDSLKGCLIYNHGAYEEIDENVNECDSGSPSGEGGGDTTACDDVNGPADEVLAWAGGTSMTVWQDGRVTVFANGTTDTITATHIGGLSDTIQIEATADKFDSLEIHGLNIGAPGCAGQPSLPTDGLQGCEVEASYTGFWLVGKRADASVQNLTYMVSAWGDDSMAHMDASDTSSPAVTMFEFKKVGSAMIASVADADNNGGYTDSQVNVNTTSGMGIPPTVCTAACPASVTANVRVYDADPTQGSMAVTATPAASAQAPNVIQLKVTAKPNQASAPTIDLTYSVGYKSSNRGAFYVFDDVYAGRCLAMPVAVAATSDITATFDSAGGTSTTISKDITLTANP